MTTKQLKNEYGLAKCKDYFETSHFYKSFVVMNLKTRSVVVKGWRLRLGELQDAALEGKVSSWVEKDDDENLE